MLWFSQDRVQLLARLLTRVPDKNEVCVRYYDVNSVRRRAHWRRLDILTDTPGRRRGTPGF